MQSPRFPRRRFLHFPCAAVPAFCWAARSLSPALAAADSPLHLACNQYVWFVFYQRDHLELAPLLDRALGEMASVGIDGYEPGLGSAAEAEALLPLLARHGLGLRSIYVNSTLHDPALVDANLAGVLAIARSVRPAGTRIVVTNPSPIQWGGPQNKDDAQLRCQAEALNRLGRELEPLGMRLAYHNHDLELRNAAREFHHMMCGTDPRYVHLCLDAHWIYRGSGNSSVALFDVVRLYGPRVIELHLRQSRQQVWTETLGDGDIDYPRLVARLAELRVHPHLVLEQAVEEGTPHTLDVVGAHRQTVAYVRRVFAPLAG